MRLLVIFAHPSETSFSAALFRAACAALISGGHELRIRDLYREDFEPVMLRAEWEDYLSHPERSAVALSDHVEDLHWAEGLVFVYPTWWYGPPAILKGWFERVWLPGVAFEVSPHRHGRIRPKLRNIRFLAAITTSGSPWWWLRVVRDPGRNLLMRGMRPLLHPRCRIVWHQLHRMNHVTESDRSQFLERVSAALQKV